MGNELTTLDGLAMQAQTFAGNVASNLMQLGRVFTEAKPLVKHGDWEKWVSVNSGMSLRWAQNCMAAYERYGNVPMVEGLSKSQIWGLLALPQGKEDEFFDTHDVKSMTSREINDAVKQVRSEMQAQIDKAQAEADEARREADEILNRPVEIPQEITDQLREKDDTIKRYKDEITAAGETNRELLDSRLSLDEELGKARSEIKDYARIVEEQQADIDDMRMKLLDAQSDAAKKDAEHEVSEKLTPDAFVRAVRIFMGEVAQMPYMGNAFAKMTQEETDVYESCLKTVADWCVRAQKALGTVNGVIISEEAGV